MSEEEDGKTTTIQPSSHVTELEHLSPLGSPPTRTLSLLNSIHIDSSNDREKKERSDTVSLNLTQDIYSFFLLLHAVPFEMSQSQSLTGSIDCVRKCLRIQNHAHVT
eukprot:174589_1